jgi:hypothetical protein
MGLKKPKAYFMATKELPQRTIAASRAGVETKRPLLPTPLKYRVTLECKQ